MPYKDPIKAKAYAKEHYKKNKPQYLSRAKKFTKNNRKAVRDWVWTYYTEHPCVDCGASDPLVLQFDHLRDKKFSIADGVNRSFSLEVLKAEVEKCEVRCANCHQRKTSLERGWWKDKL
jgi:L-lysine 2,3-aminomutase